MTKHLSETERRRQILRSARNEFVRKGYQDARVEDVAREASLSKGAVYFYFPSKRDLFMALVLEEHEATYALLEDAETDDSPALVRLLNLGWRYIDHFAEADAPPRVNLMMCELGMRDDDIREEVQAIHHRFVDALARIVAQGISEGSFHAADPLAIAEMLKAMIDGFAGQAAIGVHPDRQRLVTEGFQMILRGVLADPGQATMLSQSSAVAATTGAVR
jgi:AcrR family transcriptional regulator